MSAFLSFDGRLKGGWFLSRHLSLCGAASEYQVQPCVSPLVTLVVKSPALLFSPAKPFPSSNFETLIW